MEPAKTARICPRPRPSVLQNKPSGTQGAPRHPRRKEPEAVITLNLSDQTIKSLSKPELGVLKYAYENTEKLLDMTIQELSEQVCYSSATILRFCKKLGYSGFAEFKYALRAELRAAETAKSGSTRSGRDFTTGMLTDTISSNVQATSKLMREESLEQAFRFLDSGCPIYLWSPGGLTSVAVEYFEKLLLSIGRQGVYFIESVRMFEHILRSRPREALLILISTSGRYETTIRLAKIAQAEGIPILSITPYSDNEIAELADVNFRFFANQREHLGAEFTSRLPIFFVINTIIQCYLRLRDAREREGGGHAPTV